MTASEGAVPPGENGASPLRRTPRPKHARLRLITGLVVLSAFVIAGSIWLGVKASTISDRLEAAVSLAPRLKQQILKNDSVGAAETSEALRTHTAEARGAASDPLWTMAAALPWIGSNFQAVSTVATSADDVANLAADPLVKVLHTFDWQSLSPGSEGIDLKPLVDAQPKLSAAAVAVEQSAKRLDAVETSTLIPQVAGPLIEARKELSSLRGGLTTAASVARIAPSMMGVSEPREYLLMIQNNAEARATGGIPGAIAILKLDNGKLSLGTQTSATELGVMSPPVRVESEQQQIYSGRMGKFMQDVNLTPDFPSSATTAMSMWEQKKGKQLDGVISIDPVALSYLLPATGPVELDDPQLQGITGGALPSELTGKNVVKTLLSDVYSKISEPAIQDVYFAGVAQELFKVLSDGKSDPKKLLDGISRGVKERRISLWSGVADEQAVIANYPLSGSISGESISPAQFGVYFNDGTGAKMDYYVKRTVQLVTECAADGYSQIKVRITSTNTAPKDAATSLPEYVTGGGAFGVPAGTVQTNVVAYGPVQANVENAFVAGKKVGFASHRHSGRPVGAVTVRLAPGQSNTVEFTFGKIVQHTEPQLSVTPTVQAIKDVALDTISEKCAPDP